MVETDPAKSINTPTLQNEEEVNAKIQEPQSNNFCQERYQSYYSNLNHVRLSSGGITSRSSHYSRHAYDPDQYVSQDIFEKNSDTKEESKKFTLFAESNMLKKEPFPVKETKSSMQRKRTSRKKIDTSWRILNSFK